MQENLFAYDAFGRLAVLGPAGRGKYGHKQYLCLCACGKRVVVRGDSLLAHRTRSCGCWRRERAAKLRRKQA
jgi:hypothetical protein